MKMMKNLLKLTIAAALSLSASVATAGDWNGFTVGLVAGSSTGSLGDFVLDTAETNAAIPDSHELVDADDIIDLSGTTAGLSVGWNIDTGSWVFGVEGDYSTSTFGGAATINEFGTDNDITVSGSTVVSARARVGYKAGDDTLIYATGGIVQNTLDMNWIENGQEDDFANTYQGITYGVGIEQMITSKVSIGVEYQMTTYDAINNETLNNTLGGDTFDIDSNLSANSINVSVRMHF